MGAFDTGRSLNDTHAVRKFLGSGGIRWSFDVPLLSDFEDHAAGDVVDGWESGESYLVVGEVRISASPRSVDWVSAQYLSMTDAFIDYYPIEVY